MNRVIEAEGIVHSYAFPGSKHRSLDGFTLSVAAGEFVAVLGVNGSGKTTFAKHLNVLLELQEGTLTVASMDAADNRSLWKIRREAGMVFQNPENQFVSSIVEEDVSFGPLNFGLDEEDAARHASEALSAVGMDGFGQSSPHLLSGGQKQRIAIAGVLASDPAILICDEITSMLDPEGRRDVLEILRRLHRQGKTVLMITHYVEEAAEADRVVLVSHGKVIREGTPREILTDIPLLAEAGLTAPLTVRLYADLKAKGKKLPFCPLTADEFVEAVCP